MTIENILRETRNDGVTLEISETGSVRASGNREAVARWLPVLRVHRDELVAEIRARSCWWRVTFHDGGVRTIFIPGGDTREGLLRAYPAATKVEPHVPVTGSPDAPMSVTEQTAIKDWLMSIGETDSGAIAHALEVCQGNGAARAYVLSKTETTGNEVK